MSDCQNLIEIVQQKNEEIRKLKQHNEMLQAQNEEWQRLYEVVCNLAHKLYKNKRVGE